MGKCNPEWVTYTGSYGTVHQHVLLYPFWVVTWAIWVVTRVMKTLWSLVRLWPTVHCFAQWPYALWKLLHRTVIQCILQHVAVFAQAYK